MLGSDDLSTRVDHAAVPTSLTGDEVVHGSPSWRTPRPSSVFKVLVPVAFALPAVAYLWLIARYAVNAIYGDQWWDVRLIGFSYSGHLTLSDLWAQHHENRIFFPNLIMLGVAHTTHFNVIFEVYLSALVMFAAVGLLILTHRRRSSSRRWIYYLPVPIVLLSFVQYVDTLWGFQMAWYLVMLSLVVSLFCLDRKDLTRSAEFLAIAVAIVGSFSSIQGLLIWPAGLVLLYHRRRRWGHTLVWIGSAVATAALYFYNFNTTVSAPDHDYAIQHPLTSLKFFLFLLGDVVGVRTSPRSGNSGVELLGAGILVMALIAILSWGIRRDGSGPAPIGVALIVFGIMFAALVTEGRVLFGLSPSGAGDSRYTTFDLLVLAGTYLVFLGRSDRVACTVKQGKRKLTRESYLARSFSLNTAKWSRILLPVMSLALAAAICLQVTLGFDNGLSGSKQMQATFRYSTVATVHAARWPQRCRSGKNKTVCDYILEIDLGSAVPSAHLLQWVKIARKYRLSLFSTNVARVFRNENPFTVSVPR